MMESAKDEVWESTDGNCFVALTKDFLNSQQVMDKVRSPAAGAIVLFAGTPRPTLYPSLP